MIKSARSLSLSIKPLIRKLIRQTRKLIVYNKDSMMFSFREKKRGADRSASLLCYRDPGYTERFATPNRPKHAQATETASKMFSGYSPNRPMIDLHTEIRVVTIAVSKVGAVSAAARIVKPGIIFLLSYR